MTNDITGKHARAERSRRKRVLAAVGTTQLLIILNGSIVNVALPSLQRELNLDLAYASWVITSYALAFGGCLLLGGRITDRIGGRRAFIIGMGTFVLASAVIGVAPEGITLIVARTVQGLSASLIAPAGLSILYATFHTVRERSRALGVYGIMATCGAMIGLVAGGILTSSLSWRWCFLIGIPFALAALIIIAVDAHASAGHQVRIDLIPAVLITATATGLTISIVEHSSTILSLSALAGTLACLVLLILHQARAPETFIPAGLFRGELPFAGLVSAGAVSFVILATGTLVSLFLQNALSVSPLTAGLMLVATPIAVAVSTAIGATLMTRFGQFALIIAGMTLLLVGEVSLTGLSASATYALNVLPALVLNGLGMGLVGMSSISAVLADAAPQDSGLAGAGQQMVQQILGAIGLAVLFAVSSAVVNASSAPAGPESTAQGVVAAQWVAAAVTATAIVVLFVARIITRRRSLPPDPVRVKIGDTA